MLAMQTPFLSQARFGLLFHLLPTSTPVSPAASSPTRGTSIPDRPYPSQPHAGCKDTASSLLVRPLPGGLVTSEVPQRAVDARLQLC